MKRLFHFFQLLKENIPHIWYVSQFQHVTYIAHGTNDLVQHLVVRDHLRFQTLHHDGHHRTFVNKSHSTKKHFALAKKQLKKMGVK